MEIYDWEITEKTQRLFVPELGLTLYVTSVDNGYRGLYVTEVNGNKLSGKTVLYGTAEEAKVALVTNLITGFMKVQTKLMATIAPKMGS